MHNLLITQRTARWRKLLHTGTQFDNNSNRLCIHLKTSLGRSAFCLEISTASSRAVLAWLEYIVKLHFIHIRMVDTATFSCGINLLDKINGISTIHTSSAHWITKKTTLFGMASWISSEVVLLTKGLSSIFTIVDGQRRNDHNTGYCGIKPRHVLLISIFMYILLWARVGSYNPCVDSCPDKSLLFSSIH